MASAPNMKVRATMDNSDLKKKSQESKAALRDFEKAGTDAVSKLGEAFGVNTGKIGQMMSSLRGLGEKMTESGNAGTAAFGKLLTGVNGLTAGLAGIGIAGVVAGFKLLNEEATAFKNTMEGASIDVMTTAYIETYRQALHDFNAETGRTVAEAQASLLKGWSVFIAQLKNEVLNMDLKTAIAGPLGAALLGGNQGNAAAYEDANAKATEAERIAKRIFDIQRRISDSAVEWARMERDIAEYKRIAYDKTADTATQQNALAKATELIRERYVEEARLRKQLADLQSQYNGLVSSSIADIDKANQLRIQEERVVVSMNNALRELGERQASITANVQKEALARAQAAAFAQQKAADAADTAGARADMAAFTASLGSTGIEMVLPKLSLPDPKSMKIPIEEWWGTVTIGSKFGKLHIALDPDDMLSISEDMENLSQQLESALTGALENIGAEIGNLIGDLATGGDAWGNFADFAISTFGDMAITIGKMAISTGVATLGIKAALESLNGYVAIAAGVALIALGSAVKAGLSNVAAGNYNASTNVASATGNYGAGSSPINTAFENREMTIKVTGTLRAEGSQLVSVIENERTRLAHTT